MRFHPLVAVPFSGRARRLARRPTLFRPGVAILPLVVLLAVAPLPGQDNPPAGSGAAGDKTADEVNDALAALVAASHRPMIRTDDGFDGPGAVFLLDGARQAMFCLIGESHGNIETPDLAAWLLRSLRPQGYTGLAVEVGPIIAEKMVELAQRDDGMAAFQSFHERWPFTVPFFFWKEEVAMWLQAHELGYALWGLDQEFIGSGRFLLGELAGLVKDEAAQARVRAWQEQAAEGMRVFAETGDSGRGFLNVVAPEELAAFGEALPAGADRARRIVEELRQTAIVYQHYRDERYYLNNHDRIRLMKRHLAGYIEKSGGLESLPKVLFKFGSVHMGRGYSPMRQLDVGNAAAELAAARFSDSFHLNVSTVRSVGADGTTKDWTEQAPELAVFGRHLDGTRWGVFDLRTLRRHFASRRNREAQPELADLAFRFDVLVMAPVFHDATPMIDLPF